MMMQPQEDPRTKKIDFKEELEKYRNLRHNLNVELMKIEAIIKILEPKAR